MKIINIKKQANYLYKRFLDARESKYKSFKVSENDFKAFKDVVGYIDILREEKLAKNTLFAKMYIYHLNQMIDTYNYNKSKDPESIDSYTSFLESEPEKELSKILDLPLDYFYKSFHRKIHTGWHDNLIKKHIKGIDVGKEYVKERYTLDFVTKNLDEKINEALIRFE